MRFNDFLISIFFYISREKTGINRSHIHSNQYPTAVNDIETTTTLLKRQLIVNISRRSNNHIACTQIRLQTIISIELECTQQSFIFNYLSKYDEQGETGEEEPRNRNLCFQFDTAEYIWICFSAVNCLTKKESASDREKGQSRRISGRWWQRLHAINHRGWTASAFHHTKVLGSFWDIISSNVTEQRSTPYWVIAGHHLSMVSHQRGDQLKDCSIKLPLDIP